jgi:hypothetical protein
MVLNKEEYWYMFYDFQALNNLNIKEKFPILVIDEILDDIHGDILFNKLGLHLGYHQI